MAVPVVEALVFDVLGTLVDEPAGIRAAIGEAAPDLDGLGLEALLGIWQRHIAHEQERIVAGERPFTPSAALDREAAVLVAEAAGIGDGAVERLAGAGRRLRPWPDTVAGLARLAERFPIIGLSNADRPTLLRLNAHAGLRWHQALSAEEAGTYKPAPEVYRLAVEAAGVAPERLLMVAAHAWDLRGAQAVGMRTAYVARPVGDPPAPQDGFDLRADGLDDLAGRLEPF
ncbi:haloacid dehalogenase type II [Glycomyces sp. NRRL B-16210]|uniref:haloacid dehalogenase type II n=1 Tax=Glycomyces sp. NRRL B-16210 TaxID=1463821 RepID=UPI0004C1219B|nr:haloacid dehalogenase type II [Glycomyces sp. NRRL B-16210]